MTQPFRVLATLSEDISLISCTHTGLLTVALSATPEDLSSPVLHGYPHE